MSGRSSADWHGRSEAIGPPRRHGQRGSWISPAQSALDRGIDGADVEVGASAIRARSLVYLKGEGKLSFRRRDRGQLNLLHEIVIGAHGEIPDECLAVNTTRIPRAYLR